MVADPENSSTPKRPSSVRRLSLVISTLDGGGGARSMCNLANHWAAAGRHVTLITLTSANTDFYSIHPAIKRIGLDVGSKSHHALKAVAANRRRLVVLRRAIERAEPDAVVSFMDRTNILTLLATVGLNVPIVVCEQNDPRVCPIAGIWAFLRLVTYPLADAVILLSAEQLPWARRRLASERVHVIPNPIPVGRLPSRGREENPGNVASQRLGIANSSISEMFGTDRRILLAVGRLDHQKGFDLLIPIFARVAGPHPDWDLVILGEGPERAALEDLVDQLGIETRVALPGQVSNVGAWLDRADLFVLSSRYEGFPNALLEAMAAGLPVVSFDCPTGPSDIIRGAVDGLLVPPGDSGALEVALDTLMTDDQRRHHLGSRAVEGIERFSLETIVPLWDELLDELVEAQ